MFIAKPDTWYDEGTEATLIGEPWDVIGGKAGVFCGIRNGSEDEEVCAYDEFVVAP